MTFNEWLNDQKYRTDVVGSFAKDAMDDDTFPDIDSFDGLIAYMFEQEVPRFVYQVLEDIWKEYELCLKTK